MDPKKVAHEVRDVSSGVRLFTDWARSPDRFLAFRGQANLNWEVLPQVLRPDLGVAAHEDELVRELISLHPAEFPTDTSMFDKLVRMQHFALPTRLLDVTVNPLVALYFATDEDPRDTGADGAIIVFDGPNTRRKYFDSDTVSCIANLSNLSIEERDLIEKTKATTIPEFNRLHAVDRLLQFIRVEKPYLKERIVRTDLFKPNYVVPKMSNKRLIAQSGSFMIFGLDRDAARYTRDIKSTKVGIPNACKNLIRSELGRLGINDSTLFPEIDRAARHIVKKFGLPRPSSCPAP